MTARAITPAGFEAKFLGDDDPWHYETSAFERHKRSTLLRACAGRRWARGLELACANGVTTRELANHCRHLLAVDASAAAVATARRRCAGLGRVRIAAALLPQGYPRGRFDLIVVSELAYYLSPADIVRLGGRIVHSLAPRGRVIAVHSTWNWSDARWPSRAAHALLRQRLARHLQSVLCSTGGRFWISVLDRPSALAAPPAAGFGPLRRANFGAMDRAKCGHSTTYGCRPPVARSGWSSPRSSWTSS